MSTEEVSKRKSFTLIWKIENVNYCQLDKALLSPAFTVDEVNKTNWELSLTFYLSRDCESELTLKRQLDKNGSGNVEIDYEFAFLSSDGTVLHSFEEKNTVLAKNGSIYVSEFPSWDEVFFEKRSAFLSQNTLTVRCRIWKSVGEISKDVVLFARTRIPIEKRSFLWNIENISFFELHHKVPYEITSLQTSEQLMLLELFVTRGQIYDEAIHLKVIPNIKLLTMSALKLSIIDASKNTVECFQYEFWIDFPHDSKEFTLFNSKRALIEKEREYLLNDILSLSCECSFSFGTIVKEIEGASSGIENPDPNLHCFETPNELPIRKSFLVDDLKSMMNNSMLSDVKLKTKSKTYPAHKFMLGLRSPVFKAMFSNDMKENSNDTVNIDDLNDETILHMLRYIYCAEVKELEWGSATELYEAADKYEILKLKDICSSYLKSNLSPSNACEALVVADLHQDKNLKSFVQDFILRHGENIIISEEWDQLMEANLKLAAETMRQKYKKEPN